MKHAVKHDLEVALAKKATQRAFDSYAERFAEYSPKADWTTDTRCEVGFEVKGVKLKGVLEILPDKVEMDLDVPFIFRPFKNRALGVIEGEVKNWIEKAKNGELN